MKLRSKFTKVAGSGLVATGLALGIAAPVAIACNYTHASTTPPSSEHQALPIDILFNFATPLFPQYRYQDWIRDDQTSLDSVVRLYTIEANTAPDAIAQVVAGVKDAISTNGGPVKRIIINGDGLTNMIANPLPKAHCPAHLPDLPDVPFCLTRITDILQGLVDLKNQDFPGHKAGEPLAKALDMVSCDIFATKVGPRRLPAKEISQLATQLDMPIIASATEVGYRVNKLEYWWTTPQEKELEQVTGDFYAMLPDGRVGYLYGPISFTGEDFNANEAWIKEDGFSEVKIIEPVANKPFSVVNPVVIADAGRAPAAASQSAAQNTQRLPARGPTA